MVSEESAVSLYAFNVRLFREAEEPLWIERSRAIFAEPPAESPDDEELSHLSVILTEQSSQAFQEEQQTQEVPMAVESFTSFTAVIDRCSLRRFL